MENGLLALQNSGPLLDEDAQHTLNPEVFSLCTPIICGKTHTYSYGAAATASHKREGATFVHAMVISCSSQLCRYLPIASVLRSRDVIISRLVGVYVWRTQLQWRVSL